ncbi:MAG: HAD-IIIA family hydrolase [Fimbriimonas sp.]|nr:HAD-IIIA family hydrolase [Fimbriimonas sp.]
MGSIETVAPRAALFLDRDGVIIENRPNYVRQKSDVSFIDEAIVAGREVTQAGHPIFVVSNQAVVGKGIMPLDEVVSINEWIMDSLRSKGVGIVAAYICPHVGEDNCDCRKPRPGMLIRAASEHGLDLSRSVMVGDNLRDLQAAEAAGAKGKLVRTGMGADQEQEVLRVGLGKWLVFDHLLHALPSILSDLEGSI